MTTREMIHIHAGYIAVSTPATTEPATATTIPIITTTISPTAISLHCIRFCKQPRLLNNSPFIATLNHRLCCEIHDVLSSPVLFPIRQRTEEHTCFLDYSVYEEVTADEREENADEEECNVQSPSHGVNHT